MQLEEVLWCEWQVAVDATETGTVVEQRLESVVVSLEQGVSCDGYVCGGQFFAGAANLPKCGVFVL